MVNHRVDSPRADKVAVVEEVRGRLSAAAASVVTEYRGLTVAELAELRASLNAVGGDYKVFKNTLVRRAVDGGEHEPLQSLLVGPTALAFVHGDVSAVAKALRDFSRTRPNLVVKGGMLEGNLLSAGELTALADLPSRDVLLAQLAGTIAAPMRQLAGLLAAVPRNLAYGISALLDQLGGAPESEPVAGEAIAPEEAVEDAAGTEAAAEQPVADEEAALDQPVADEGAAQAQAAADEGTAQSEASDETLSAAGAAADADPADATTGD